MTLAYTQKESIAKSKSLGPKHKVFTYVTTYESGTRCTSADSITIQHFCRKLKTKRN